MGSTETKRESPRTRYSVEQSRLGDVSIETTDRRSHAEKGRRWSKTTVFVTNSYKLL